MTGRQEKNFIEALAAGASVSILLVANIAVMLIAFLSMKAFLNAILTWAGNMINVKLSFEVRSTSYPNFYFLTEVNKHLIKKFIAQKIINR